jgi:uncharacterized protein DUF2442
VVRIRSVRVLESTRVELGLTDGTALAVDLAPYLRGPVFERVRSDPEYFREVRVDPQLGTIVWPDGADIDPDVLVHRLAPA